MVPFHELIEGSLDPELRKAAKETWDAIREKIVCLRDRFGLAWVDSAQGEEKITMRFDKQ